MLSRLLGMSGERAAARHLRRGGVRILQRNFRCPVGEIDLIGAESGAIIFFEVKTRRSDDAADPENSVGTAKRRRMARAAEWWLAHHGHPQAAYRFDAISIVMPPRGKPEIRRIVDAFTPHAH